MSSFSGTCPHAPTCALYEQFTLQSSLKLWQIKYCESDYSRCARYQQNTAGISVPRNLLPNGLLLKLRKV